MRKAETDEFGTKRLSAGPLSLADRAGFAALKADARVVEKYFSTPKTAQQSEEKLRQLVADHLAGDSYCYALRLREGGAFVGTIVLWNLDRDSMCGEVGYELLPEYWGRGLMREALPAFLRHMKDHYGFHRFTACPGEGNEASNRLLLSAGFLPTGAVEEGGHLLTLYQLRLKDEGEDHGH